MIVHDTAVFRINVEIIFFDVGTVGDGLEIAVSVHAAENDFHAFERIEDFDLLQTFHFDLEVFG